MSFLFRFAACSFPPTTQEEVGVGVGGKDTYEALEGDDDEEVVEEEEEEEGWSDSFVTNPWRSGSESGISPSFESKGGGGPQSSKTRTDSLYLLNHQAIVAETQSNPT